ncbi:hypothetical protein G6F57_004721 [Rhizopus arrhizus]|uniref:NTF2-domain-containing protein n=1 Tax=Rhizopus oryzae TaxID=64495 RepID=A0A9P6XCC9_RHIOR|nr:hypothetical protein G6F23_001119 [Rhizopus arrhizus]KAG1425785.1 hypothetical protein G6F58_001786 [Rhizopus delemar]KAG0765475.1 hypothetical protein G6F24_004397 [Rhizopus arrhizus]KAG0781344.1 hypothetical protein G6F22_009620 [Rhizopus arrhizus]KAG0793162.1 hypothetical protein G6F21_003821 [Rhizopus arrhizus]
MTNSGILSPSKEVTATQSSQDVGLIFVREYYTFLNKKPNRLHAFYSKDSLLVRGDEGTVTETARGQEEIRKKIEECNFEDCKVLVTQVDSQLSANDGILIHVLGEMCNQNGPSQKFSQTFFLATQPNGYYVLNDMFRFLKDEVEIDYYTCEEEKHTPTPTSPSTEEVPEEVKVEEKKEEPVKKEIKKEEEPVKKKEEEPVNKKEEPVEEVKKGEVKKVEEKKQEVKKPEVVSTAESVSAPVIASPIPSKASIKEEQHEEKKKKFESKQPNKQSQQKHESNKMTAKTWANLTAAAAASNGFTTIPATTTTATTATAATAATAVPTTPTTPAPAPTPTPAPAEVSVPVTPAAEPPVTSNTEKPVQPQQQTHQHKNQAPRNKDSITQIFVKQVYEGINEDQLREAFTKIGAVKHINISRPRNCAFIEFASSESVPKALALHKIPLSNGSTVLAEERRFTNSNQSGNRYNNQGRNQNYNNANNNFERRPNNHRRQGQNTRNNNNTGKGRGTTVNNNQK